MRGISVAAGFLAAALARGAPGTASPSGPPVHNPPCGERGMSPDGIRCLETFPGNPARRVLFGRIGWVGRDEPLFDENSLRLLPPPGAPPTSKPASR